MFPKLLRLFGALFSMSLRRQLTFRADMVFELLVTALALASSLLALAMVYTRTDALGGWSHHEAVVLIGTFQLVSGLRSAFVEPNMQWFGNRVKNGEFDAILVQPAPAIFLATLGSCAPFALAQVGLGAGVVVYGLQLAGVVPTVAAVAGWLALVGAAIVVMWATRTMLAAIVFWAMEFSLDIVYDAMWQFARYPTSLYRRPLRLVFTYVLPVAFIATVPADVLLHGEGYVVVPIALLVALLAFGATVALWRTGLRRYTSATS